MIRAPSTNGATRTSRTAEDPYTDRGQSGSGAARQTDDEILGVCARTFQEDPVRRLCTRCGRLWPFTRQCYCVLTAERKDDAVPTATAA